MAGNQRDDSASDDFIIDPGVFRAEVTDICERLKTVDTAKEKRIQKQLGDQSDLRPSTEFGLVGLALSGGGIRSATFNLGVLQALHKHEVFPHIDYLSTVSGGGYIGSCLSSVQSYREPDGDFGKQIGRYLLRAASFLKRDSMPEETGEAKQADFPFCFELGVHETREVQHLREYANYLAPRGLLDWLRLPALAIRGIIINAVIVLPYLLLAAVVTALVAFGADGALNSGRLIKELLTWVGSAGPVLSWLAVFDQPFALTKLVAAVFLGACALYPFLQFFIPSTWRRRNRATHSLALGLLALAVVAFFEAQLPLIDLFHDKLSAFLFGFLVDFSGLSGDDLTVLGVVSATISAMFSGKFAAAFTKAGEKKSGSNSKRKKSGLMGGSGLYVVGALSFAAFWLIYYSFSRWAIYAGEKVTEIAGADTLTVAPAWLIGMGTWWAKVLAYFGFGWAQELARGDLSNPDAVLIAYLCVALLLFLVTWLFVDVNRTSLHNFYRDRLSRAYIIGRPSSDPDEIIPRNEGQRLSELDPAVGPYHLINAALNIQHSKTGNLRGRDADFFIFSRNYVGGELTGYAETRLYEEKLDPHVNLATAMAISGAAAAPNMGRSTKKPVVFLLAMLNVRLGYWLPNPGRFPAPNTKARFKTLADKFCERIEKGVTRIVSAGPAKLLSNGMYFLVRPGYTVSRLPGVVAKPLARMTNRPGPLYLIKEAFSRLNETGWYVNLSDGGHMENLGLYELLRRRCRLIIVGDGEADPEMKFTSLARVIRLARIDMGIQIEIDLKQLRKDKETGLSRRHYAFGTIDYGGGKNGCLLYIKSSVTGDEVEYVTEYRATHQAFPHETTADQFFDEAQFEAYRALGYHAVNLLMIGKDAKPAGKGGVNKWFEACGVKLSAEKKPKNNGQPKKRKKV